MQHQDLKPVIWVKSNAKLTREEKNKAVLRGDKKVATVKKITVGNSESKKALDIGTAKKLDNETETFRVPALSHKFQIALQQARTAKKLTQKELASKIGETESIVQGYESGKTIPTQRIIAKLNLQLAVTLPKVESTRKM